MANLARDRGGGLEPPTGNDDAIRVRLRERSCEASTHDAGTTDHQNGTLVDHGVIITEMPPSVRARAVREMARVTQPNGTVVVVDYAIPHAPILGALMLRLVSLYERDHYVEFVHSNVGALLKDAGIMTCEQHRALLGNAQVVIGRKPT